MLLLVLLVSTTALAKQIVIEYDRNYPFMCGQAIPDYHNPNAFAKIDTFDVFDHRLIICQQSFSKEDITKVRDFIKEDGFVGFNIELWDGSVKSHRVKLGSVLNDTTIIMNYFFDFHFTVDQYREVVDFNVSARMNQFLKPDEPKKLQISYALGYTEITTIMTLEQWTAQQVVLFLVCAIVAVGAFVLSTVLVTRVFYLTGVLKKGKYEALDTNSN